MKYTLEEVLQKSEPALKTIKNDAVRLAAAMLVELTYQGGVGIRITHGTRTLAQQQELYNKGRNSSGKVVNRSAVVTDAKPGSSYHNWDMAIDFVLLEGVYDMNIDADGDGVKDWVEVVTLAKQLGFTWGGDWTSFKDYPHFQMTFGYSIKQLNAGSKPSQKQITAKIQQLNTLRTKLREGDDVTKVEQLTLKVEELTKAVTALEKRVNISGNQQPPAWALPTLDKAKSLQVITTINDKSQAEIIMLKVLDNMGLLDKETLQFIRDKAFKTREGKA